MSLSLVSLCPILLKTTMRIFPLKKVTWLYYSGRCKISLPQGTQSFACLLQAGAKVAMIFFAPFAFTCRRQGLVMSNA